MLLFLSKFAIAKLLNILNIILLGHSAINCEVEGVRGADKDVDDEDKPLSHIVVHDLKMKTLAILPRNGSENCLKISQSGVFY